MGRLVRRQSIQCNRCHSQINTIPCCYVGETNRHLATRARGGDCGGGGGGCGGGSVAVVMLIVVMVIVVLRLWWREW